MRITAIFDINHFFHTEYSVWSLRSKGEIRNASDEASLMVGLISRFAATLSKMPVSEVIVCADSKSWRKGVEIPATPENPEGIGYKGSRDEKKDKTMDKETQSRFYNLIRRFGDLVTTRGITYSTIEGFEGDDLVSAWAKHKMAKGESCIVITGDGDVQQIVDADWDKNCWTIVWSMNSNANKLFIPENWKRKVLIDKEKTIFDMGIGAEDQLKQMIQAQQITLVETDPKKILFEKIMYGDDGDDVPSVWSVKTKTKKGADKVVRVTPKILSSCIEWMKTEKHMEDTKSYPDIKDPKQMWLFAGVILRTLGGVDGVDERKAFIERFKLNKTLVSLVDDYLPSESLKIDLNEHIKTNDGLIIKESDAQWSKQGLLGGTEFESGIADRKYDQSAFADQLGFE